MVDREYIYVPQSVEVSFEIAPALNALQSIHHIGMTRVKSGFGEWPTEMANTLPREILRRNDLINSVLDPLCYKVIFPGLQYESFPAYIDAIAAMNPVEMRDKIMATWMEWGKLEDGETIESLLASREKFMAWVNRLFAEKMHHADKQEEMALFSEGYDLYVNPPLLYETAVNHLRYIWDNHLAAEWQRVLPMLRESAAAYSRLDFSNMSAEEALRKVTGRDLREAYGEKLIRLDSIVFVPSAHIGPYVSLWERDRTGFAIFGARLPREAQITSSELSRAELVTRLSALADNTRLHILELLTKHEELCAQDIIEILNLSQSSVSRHLSQLSATGYITERRKDVAKCYSLNTERVHDIMRALTNFLAKKP